MQKYFSLSFHILCGLFTCLKAICNEENIPFFGQLKGQQEGLLMLF
jgi:hypothetical protein